MITSRRKFSYSSNNLYNHLRRDFPHIFQFVEGLYWKNSSYTILKLAKLWRSYRFDEMYKLPDSQVTSLKCASPLEHDGMLEIYL